MTSNWSSRRRDAFLKPELCVKQSGALTVPENCPRRSRRSPKSTSVTSSGWPLWAGNKMEQVTTVDELTATSEDDHATMPCILCGVIDIKSLRHLFIYMPWEKNGYKISCILVTKLLHISCGTDGCPKQTLNGCQATMYNCWFWWNRGLGWLGRFIRLANDLCKQWDRLENRFKMSSVFYPCLSMTTNICIYHISYIYIYHIYIYIIYIYSLGNCLRSAYAAVASFCFQVWNVALEPQAANIQLTKAK